MQDGYALVNARLGYTFSERFTIEAFVTNLFDEDYIKDAGNTGDAAGPADLHRRRAADVRDAGERALLSSQGTFAQLSPNGVWRIPA